MYVNIQVDVKSVHPAPVIYKWGSIPSLQWRNTSWSLVHSRKIRSVPLQMHSGDCCSVENRNYPLRQEASASEWCCLRKNRSLFSQFFPFRSTEILCKKAYRFNLFLQLQFVQSNNEVFLLIVRCMYRITSSLDNSF